MKEIGLLIEKANRYLKSANLLLEDGDYDSSVSRAYYAMPYSAQAMLLTKKLSVSSHKGVISTFGEHFIKTGVFPKEMGRELNRTFAKRQLGDYDYTSVIAQTEAEQVWENSKHFVATITQHLKQQKII